MVAGSNPVRPITRKGEHQTLVEFVVSDHHLVPKHVKLSPEEKEKVLVEFNSTQRQMPSILDSDAALAGLEAEPGDIIKIERASQLTGTAIFYRVVIHG